MAHWEIMFRLSCFSHDPTAGSCVLPHPITKRKQKYICSLAGFEFEPLEQKASTLTNKHRIFCHNPWQAHYEASFFGELDK